MKWKTHKHIEPRLSDTRTVHKFAFFPVDLDDGNTVWLESYKEDQKIIEEIRYSETLGYSVLARKWKSIKRYQIND